MIVVETDGNFDNLERLLRKKPKNEIVRVLNALGKRGVEALSTATPVDSGRTASSWDYTVEVSGGSCSIYWTNSHVNRGVSIAVILQTGHGTGTGGYVQGRDYINPAIRPVFDDIANKAWRAVIT